MRFCLVASALAAVLVTAVAPASAQAPRAEANTIRGIEVEETSDSTVIVVHGSAHPTFNVFKLEDPVRLFVDIANGDVSEARSSIDVDNGVVGQVGTLQFRDDGSPIGRVIIGLQSEAAYRVDADGTSIRVVIDGARRNAGAATDTGALRAEQERVRAAVDRERDLLQKLKLERLKEEQLRQKAEVQRRDEEALRGRMEQARAAAEQARAAEQAKVDALRSERDALAKAIDEQARAKQALEAALPETQAAREAEQARLAELEAAVAAGREKVKEREAALSASLREKETAVAELEAAWRDQKEQNAELQAEVGIQQARVRALRDDLDREQQKLAEVTAARQQEEARVASLRQELDQGRRALDKVREELAAAEQARDAAGRAEASDAAARQAEVARLQGELASREQDVARLADALDRARVAEAEVHRLKGQLAQTLETGKRDLDERERAIARLERELEAARQAATQAQTTGDALTQDLAAAKRGSGKDAKEARKRLQAALDAARDAKAAAGRLEKELGTARKASADAAAARADLDRAVKERDERIAALEGALGEQQRLVKTLEAERARIEAEAQKDAQVAERALATKVAALEARVAQERARAGAAAPAIADLERQLAEARREGEARAQKAQKDVEARLLALQAQLAQAGGAAKDVAAVEARYKDEVARLEARIAQSDGALRASDERIAAMRARQEEALRQAELAREQAAREAEAARLAREQAERQAQADRAQAARDAEAARAAKAEAEQVLSAARQQTAAPAGKPVGRIDYREDAGRSRVEIGVTTDTRYEVIDQSETQAVLLLRGVALPAELRRSLDVSDFHGAVTMVSSFESTTPGEQGDVRVVVNLRHTVPNRLRREQDTLVWEFEQASAVAPPRTNPAQTGPAQATRPAAPPSDAVRYYPNVVSQAAAAPADAPGYAPVNPYFDKRKKKKRYTGKRINLTIKDADIQHVLTFLAKEGKVNIIAGDDVSGTVTFHLEDIPWDLALDMILRTKGLDYVKEEGIYRVAPIDSIKKEIDDELEKRRKRVDLKPLFVRLVPVNYGKAGEVAEQVSKILSPKGSVTTDARTNTLIIKDIEDHIIAAEDLVRRLDTQTPQVLIEARIVEASSSFSQDVGIQWGGNFAMSPVFGNETGLSFPSILGISGGAAGRQTITDGLFTNQPGFAVNLPAPVGQGTGGAIGFTLGNLSQSANLNLRLSAAEEEGSVKIVSSPKISTLDNAQATIQQGVSIPISVVSAQGVNTQFFSADLKLSVTPHVTQDGTIAMKIDISKNEPDFGRTGANGNPTIQKKEAHTELLLRDGDTTVIGGIYTRNQGTNYSKVPLLGDIPILGWLFKTRSETDQRSELLIFLTPRIVNRQASVAAP